MARSQGDFKAAYAWLNQVLDGDVPWSMEVAQRHQVKRGTATMGGLLLLAGGLVATLIWARWDAVLVPTLVGVTLLFGAVGALDDLIKIRHPVRKGLGRRGKMVLLSVIYTEYLMTVDAQTLLIGKVQSIVLHIVKSSPRQ